MASPITAAQRLQLLADAMAEEFCQSQASSACAAALTRLLPSLQYLSIAVSNPAQGGGIVASTNCATEGPTTLHLHDPLSSAAGRVVALGKPLQTSLLDGAAATVLPLLTDVQLMVAQAPGVTHLLCIPFGCDSAGGSEEDGATASGDGVCMHHSLRQGSGRGALLFGFSAAPELDARRKALLAGLAQCLPAPMACLSADTLAFVNFVCGSNAQCSCCCSAAEEEEEEEEGASAAGPCREDDGGSSDGGGAAPSQALQVPAAVGAASGGASGGDTAGPSSRWWEKAGKEEKGGLKASPAAAATAAAAHESGSAQAPSALSAGRLASLAGGSPTLTFSKALLAAAAEQGEGITQQSALSLTFTSFATEQEYRRWIAQYHIKVDLLFSLLLMASLFIVSFMKPYRLIDQGPLGMLLGAGMALPLLLNCLARKLYTAWRECLAAVLRLYVVAFITLVSIRSYQADLPAERLLQWITFWMLTGAESLAITALGFPVRLQLHLPLQFAAMGVAAWNIPAMCSQIYPGTEAATCFGSSIATAALFGFILPTVGLRYIEQRSRALFSNQLRSAAAHEA